MSVELGSFWLIKDSGCIATVKSMIAKANGGATVIYTLTDSSGISSYRMSCEYELFINIAEKLITKSDLKDDLNKEYVKGKTDGYNEGCQHGFTLAKEKITELDKEELESQYQRGLKEGEYLERLDSLNSRQHHYHMGYDDALANMASEESENSLELKKQGFEEGYNTAIREMSNNQALGETTEGTFVTEDCCEHHNPNKETQEAMQEVSGKVKESIEDMKAFLKQFNEEDGEDEQLEKELALVEKYPHYYKDIRHLNILDIYRFFDLFEVKDPCLQHSIKKQAVGGKRGLKDYKKDIKEAMDTLSRWEYMQEENERAQDD